MNVDSADYQQMSKNVFVVMRELLKIFALAKIQSMLFFYVSDLTIFPLAVALASINWAIHVASCTLRLVCIMYMKTRNFIWEFMSILQTIPRSINPANWAKDSLARFIYTINCGIIIRKGVTVPNSYYTLIVFCDPATASTQFLK